MNDEMKSQSKHPRGSVGRAHGRMGGEKAKDFKGTIGKLFKYMSQYKAAFLQLFYLLSAVRFSVLWDQKLLVRRPLKFLMVLCGSIKETEALILIKLRRLF